MIHDAWPCAWTWHTARGKSEIKHNLPNKGNPSCLICPLGPRLVYLSELKPTWQTLTNTNRILKVVESPSVIFHVISEIDTKAKVCKELFFCSAFTCWAMNSSKVEPLRVKGVARYIYESIRQNAALTRQSPGGLCKSHGSLRGSWSWYMPSRL